MEQLNGQICLSELISSTLPLNDYVDKKNVGKVIPFQRLIDYIGRKVVIGMPWQSGTAYRLVMITSYQKNADHSYRLNKKTGEYEVEHTYDRIGYSDDKRRHKENAWVGEISCTNGRFKPLFEYPECFYEYKAF